MGNAYGHSRDRLYRLVGASNGRIRLKIYNVYHFMEKPDETSSLVVRDGEAVVLPNWSIHSGAGTRNYKFVWSMGGENQVFDDMDHIAPTELR